MFFHSPYFFEGGCIMKFTPLFVDPNNLMSFVNSDVFGVVLILIVLVSTLICMIWGRRD